MLPSDQRLRRRQDFGTAVRRGRRAARPTLVVHLHRGTGGPGADPATSTVAATSAGDPRASVAQECSSTPAPARAGFVVSKAVGVAVVRNRVKRRLRHLVRDRLPELPAGSLVVVRALPPAAHASHDQLARDLDAALRRLLTGARS
ncbi:ribonuclease P protein component [Mangrovactinospora gilvigrisea]|uniref:ribonuclease P protein component n=1 Tax=Mangrovactinospora gilvigrisea TaxID=1428644 RepID=UPI0008FCD958|nr:ribonuclease P protein component [Mangrovactinospora gilvigrisea]